MMIDLKTARVYRGYTQQQLADLLNVNRCTVVSWERGHKKITERNFLKCCVVLNINRRNLIVGNVTMSLHKQ